MAGMGEACSHIAVLLFTTEANTQPGKAAVHTHITSMLMDSSFIRFFICRYVSNIDFTIPKQIWQQSSNTLTGGNDVPTSKPSSDDIKTFYEELLKLKVYTSYFISYSKS